MLSDISASQRQGLDLDYGISVDGVVDDGAARDAGLRPGDVILDVDGKKVDSVAGFNRLILHTLPGKPAVLRVRRGAATSFLALNVRS